MTEFTESELARALRAFTTKGSKDTLEDIIAAHPEYEDVEAELKKELTMRAMMRDPKPKRRRR